MAELAKTFAPDHVEQKWYDRWEQAGAFKPRPGKKGECFCMVMPPPNITGILHIGHALNVTIQDVLTRYKRMKGYETLWLPGTDHAGIATQSAVEKKLYAEEGKLRRDYTREDFLNKVWEWREHHGGLIHEQQRAMGSSCDWGYLLFTMDPESNRAVNKVFVALYEEGLIYQSNYIVNWDTQLQTAISDAEVEHREVMGASYHIKYRVKGEERELVIATTRPETMLGDTAVAVHPDDQRFKHFIGKTAIVPLCGREIPIIGDEYVDPEKGTGCLKVTPGHDFNDFELGRRHGLEILTILNQDGTFNHHGLEWQGQSVGAVRPLIIQRLDQEGLLVKKEAVAHQVGHGQRSGTVIEPMVSKQWFVRVQEMADSAAAAVAQDHTRFYPKGWENTYFAWLKEPRDWCISRQLWWGHRIPVFTCQSCAHQWAAEEPSEHCPQCQHTQVVQDPDVLDTWFSSALWPFSTLGWPDPEGMERKGLQRFYPNAVLVTGYDIIFFWVARMMMMGIKFLHQPPFPHVYIHAIVRDKYGRKMSKSLGNGIDPLDICREYGADSLRFTLAAGSGYNRTLNLEPARIEGYRNFINKLWNAFRFCHPFLGAGVRPLPQADRLTHQDRWILGELNAVVGKINDSFDEYRFDEACSALYQFTYEKFCSWYIEFSKPILYGEDARLKADRISVLSYCLRKIMALLHPVAPFISEEIWQFIKSEGDSPMLILAEYPEFDQHQCFAQEQKEMNWFIEVVTKVRNLRQSVNLPPKQEVSLEVLTDHGDLSRYLQENAAFLGSLARVSKLKVQAKTGKRPSQSLMTATALCDLFIPLAGLVDLPEQRNRLTGEIRKAEKELAKFEGKLTNAKFLAKAPHEVVLETRDKVEQFQQQLAGLRENLVLLS